MASEFVLITDDSCDLPIEYLKEREIPFAELSYTIEGKEYRGTDRPIKELYTDMRSGKMPVTSQVNQQVFVDLFSEYLEQGKDILYIAFSSGLSGTCHSGQAAAEKLKEEYPNQKIYVVDSLCASMGQGLLVADVYDKMKEGIELEELRDYAESKKKRIIHLVTVDDLMHLHRGGRISKTSAIAGSLLGIKPIIHVDNLGKLVNVDKVRGRKQSLIKLVDEMELFMRDVPNKRFFLSHGDCLEDAEFVAEQIQKRFGIKDHMINYVGAVIGSHAGPGVIALFFEGNSREL